MLRKRSRKVRMNHCHLFDCSKILPSCRPAFSYRKPGLRPPKVGPHPRYLLSFSKLFPNSVHAEEEALIKPVKRGRRAITFCARPYNKTPLPADQSLPDLSPRPGPKTTWSQTQGGGESGDSSTSPPIHNCKLAWVYEPTSSIFSLRVHPKGRRRD